MAIVPCPACGKKISNMTTICSHCGFMLGEVSEEQLEIFRQRKLRDRVYHLKMTSYAVITVFVAGFGWYWWDTSGFQNPSSSGPYILMAISAVGYLVVRALLFQTRHREKQVKKQVRLQQELRRKIADRKDKS